MKIRLGIQVFLLFSISLTIFAQTTCSYNYRKRITFNPAQVSGPSDLSNFPALISITADNDLRTVANSGHVENANGFDIIFTASDGVTLLDFQLEAYDATTGNYVAWVKIPSLSTTINTSIYMYYGNSAIATDQSTASVWSGYHGVWHFQNNSVADVSPNAYSSTNNGTTNQATAFINNGRALNGTQWIELGSAFPNLNTNFSISAWINTTNRGTAGQRIFCDDVSNTGGFGFSLGDAGGANNGILRFFSRGSTNVILDSPNGAISANNTWFYVTAVADITNNIRRLFVNGVQVSSIASVGWGTDAGNSSIGGETAAGETGNRFNGQMDEVRVANTALSADWILTEYNNQNSPSTFYTISAEPKVWTGGTSANFGTGTNWLGGVAAVAGDDVILNTGTNQPALNANIQLNSVFIRSGVTLSLLTRVLSVRQDITNCGTITGGTGGITLNSTAAFVQTHYLSGSGTYNLTNLTINNTFGTNPAVTLNKDVNVSGVLALTSGIVNTTTTNILALGNTATSGSGSAASFVNGPMSKSGNANFVFPIGDGTTWRRAAISSISAASTFRAEYFNAAPTNTSPVTAPLTDISRIENWQIDRTVGAGNAIISLYWENAGASAIDNCPDLTIARWNGTTWVEHLATTVGASSCAGAGTGTITTNAVVTAFSPFTFGSKSSALNPLPIELIEFTATCNNEGVEVNWTTSNEHNNAYFLIERSTDALNWEEVQRVYSQGEVGNMKHYDLLDDFFSEETVYYRLSQIDKDLRTTVYPIIQSNCKKTTIDFSIYPNPANDKINLAVYTSKSSVQGILNIVDVTGRLRLEKSIQLKKGRNTFFIPFELSQGIYFVTYTSDSFPKQIQKLVVE